jgi:hypothetical protein
MKKLAYVGSVAVASLLATTAVSYAKDEKPMAAPAAEKKAAAAQPTPAPAGAKPADPAKQPAGGAPAPVKMEPTKPAATDPAKPGAPGTTPPAAPMTQPKPAADIAMLYKQIQGTWKCSGTGASPDGKQMAMTFTITNKQDLDKFWIVTTMTSKKTKESPMVYKFTSYTTYDAATKKWVRVMVDNMGGWEQSTSAGNTNGQILWEGKAGGMGMTYTTKHTEQIVGPKENKMSGQMSMDGKSWMPMYDATCKK